MKKIQLLFCSIALLLIFKPSNVSAQIIPNGGFENWAYDTTGYFNPVGWVNLSSDSGTVKQGPPRTGNYSANLKTLADGAGGFNGGHLFFTTALNSQHFKIEGYWRGDFSDSLTTNMRMDVLLYDGNHNVVMTQSVEAPYANLINWTYFSLTDGMVPLGPAYIDAHLSISSTSYPINGFVDDLSLTYLTGIADISFAENLFSIFPNPATSAFTIKTNASFQNALLEIYNILGEKIYSTVCPERLSVNSEKFQAGIYYARMSDTKKQSVQKLIIQ